jgi:ATP-dependent Clp protease ATP-binding subunit ClpA
MSAPPVTRSAPPIPAWLRDLRAAVGRGQHVLLHGNVADQVHVGDGWLDVCSATSAVLSALGYGHIAVHHPAVGFDHPDPEHAAVFETRYRQAVGAPAAPANEQPGRTFRDPIEALEATRVLLAQHGKSLAIVLDHADLLLATEAAEQSRRAIALLSRAIRQAATTGSGITPTRNALVLTCPAISSPLAALLAAEPRLTSIAIPSPDLAERRVFLRGSSPAFHGGGEQAPADLERRVDAAARLTAGYTYWDLEALRRTSHQEHIGLADAHQLVMRHAHGRSESPWAQTDAELLLTAGERLREDILGQDEVIDSVVRRLISARYGVGIDRDSARRERRPRLRLFLVGPTGVGKTELCKAIARLLFGDEAALVRFDMGEYQDPASAGRLIGSDPGYVGFEEGGQLVNAVLAQPHCVLLFDEIEKAHPRVLDLFLALLDEGRLTDGHGRTADFRDTVVAFTSNAGAAEIAAAQRGGTCPPPGQVRAHFTRAVADRLSLPEAQGGINRPELYGRLRSSILPFDALRPHDIDAITAKLVRQWRENVARVHNLQIELAEREAVAAVRERVGHETLASGARPIADAVTELLDEQLAWYVAREQPVADSRLRVAFIDGKAVICAQ